MREYVLMTDSCCDLPDQMARELQLEVLPLTMHMDGQDYPNTLDGAAISNEEFYRRIRAGKMATTSAVNVGQFEDAMSAVLSRRPGYSVHLLLLGPVHHLPVRLHRGGERPGQVPGGAHPGHRLPECLPGPGAC